MGALWENYLISERIKKNLNNNLNKDLYFWRTYDGQEIDIVEVSGNDMAAFELKWGERQVKAPVAFAQTYEQATFQVINRTNYLEFVM